MERFRRNNYSPVKEGPEFESDVKSGLSLLYNCMDSVTVMVPLG